MVYDKGGVYNMIYMRSFLERLFIIMFCLLNTYKTYPHENIVLYFLVILIISTTLELTNNKRIKIPLYIIFYILGISFEPFLLYTPIILYNLYNDFYIFTILYLPLLIINFSLENVILSIFSVYIAIITSKINKVIEENKKARDKIREDALLLEKYNKQLIKDREKNIHIAVLTERNRIARNLHDSIGHTLSSSILQVESLKIISKEKNVIEKLNILQRTLTNGMDEIRNSIHNLYNESFNLKDEIEKICTNVPNLDIDIVYKIDSSLNYDMKFDVLSIIKEGITNCIKHSNADKVKITLLEQPKFYSIVIKDNGNIFDNNALQSTEGIGLLSIKEIANKYNGFFNHSFEKGFKLHITLMKG